MYSFHMPVGVTSDLPAIEKAQDFSFKIPSLQHFVGKKKKKNMAATAAAVLL